MYFYITNQNPNGTADLVVADQDAQVIGYIEQAVFGLFGRQTQSSEPLVMFHGESIGYITVDNEEDAEIFLENIYYGEISDLTPVWPITREELIANLTCSPVDTKGLNVLRQVAEISRKHKN